MSGLELAQGLEGAAFWLPVIFAFLMGLAMLLYALLDGYDLGVGILMQEIPREHHDMMVASIGPFWDANETWLVLGVGLLLVAFPMAHGIVLGNLYLPVALMLLGLILRGVAFDFRAKVRAPYKNLWNRAFSWGSIIAAGAQGYMLGSYILGFAGGSLAMAFSLLIGACFIAGYTCIGACWLIMKTEGELQKDAVAWARYALWGLSGGIVLVSMATPLLEERIMARWFGDTLSFVLLLPIPLITGAIVVYLDGLLQRLPMKGDKLCWAPFVGVAVVYVLCFLGLAYSFFPYVVPGQMTIWQSASATSSLMFILVGALIVVPCILLYTVYAYRVFWGKVRGLSY